MNAKSIGFWDWLLLPSSRLVERGVPPECVVDMRFAATGHVRAAPIAWSRAYFFWGGVATAEEIAELTQHDVCQVRQYSKDAGLRYGTRVRRHTHAQLALLLWSDRRRGPEESCLHFGVPVGARRVLCSAMQEIIDSTDGGAKRVLGWSLDKIECTFAGLGLSLTPPCPAPSALAFIDRMNPTAPG